MWNGNGVYGGTDPYGSASGRPANNGGHHYNGQLDGSSSNQGGHGGGVLDAYRDESSANAAAFAQAAQQAASLDPHDHYQSSPSAMHDEYDEYAQHGSMMMDTGGAAYGGSEDPYASQSYYGESTIPPQQTAARGKPEAMAANALRENVSGSDDDSSSNDDNEESGSDNDGESDSGEDDDDGQDQQSQEVAEESGMGQQAWEFPPPADGMFQQQQSSLQTPVASLSPLEASNGGPEEGSGSDEGDSSSSDSDDDKPIGKMGTKPPAPVPTKKAKPKAASKPKAKKAPPEKAPSSKPKKKAAAAAAAGESLTKAGTPKKKPGPKPGSRKAKIKKGEAKANIKKEATQTDNLTGQTAAAAGGPALPVSDSLGNVGKKKATPKGKAKSPKEAATPRTPKSSASKTAAGAPKTAAGAPKTAAGALPANHFSRDKEHELPMTSGEHENAKALIKQFCSLPLLAEFTKPLHVLHAELSDLYSKVVTTPMDLSYICRRLDSGGYEYARHLQLDMWRMCSNCIVFHTDSRVQKANVAIPSFVNIALHLRDYFNALWEEYMVPGYEPYKDYKARGNPERDNYASATNGNNGPSALVKAVEVSAGANGGAATTATAVAIPSCSLATTATGKGRVPSYDSLTDPTKRFGESCSVPYYPRLFEQRAANRRKRFRSAVQTALSVKCCQKAAKAIEYFVAHRGKVDEIDSKPILHTGHMTDEETMHLDSQMNQMKNWLRLSADALDAKKASTDSDDEDEDLGAVQITVHELHQHFQAVTNLSSVACRPKLQYQLRQRLDRLLHKIIVPIYEAGCRGVNQSSIWGCMAAAIWARESSRKPYWPALVLGILAPEHQKEEWHLTLTERNEARLPEKLMQGLAAGKKKATMATESRKKGEQMSYFMVGKFFSVVLCFCSSATDPLTRRLPSFLQSFWANISSSGFEKPTF
jgi:hypothetical protein